MLASVMLVLTGCSDSELPEGQANDSGGGSGGCFPNRCTPTGGATSAGGAGTGGDAKSGGRDQGGSLGSGATTSATGGGATGGGATGGATGTGGSSLDGDYSLAIDQGELTMWYDRPATEWTEALPIGNGRLGAMVFGGPVTERLQLNEETFWSGGPSRNDNPNALDALSSVRQMIFDGNYSEAETAIDQNMTATQLHGSMYQTIGDLRLEFEGHQSPTSYHRELDLQRAVATTEYTLDDITYTREVFASHPDQLIVMRLSASQPESLSFSVSLDGPLANEMMVLDDHTLQLTGTSSTHEGVEGQVDFDTRVSVRNSGGSASETATGLRVADADEVLIFVSIATNFVDYKTLTADPATRATQYLTDASGKSFPDLLQAHVSAYRDYFERAGLYLGDSSSEAPTDARIDAFSESADPELVSMYYQFGRYLLISSSQPGGQPANLQGIWNDSTTPSWDSKYTININTEMNYWPAEKTNLSELHDPLFDMIRELSEAGQQTASSMYGADGWVAHHNTDIWRITGVVDGAFWGMWPMGGAWLAQHLWERYAYSGDREFLAEAYPILRSACEFFQDFLVEEPTHQWLVVSPSISPENTPLGSSTSVVAGATMDNQILLDLFSRTIRIAEILERDEELRKGWQEILERLPPMQVGSFGQLQEWLQDWDDPNNTHRHVSHLYGLFPSQQISPYRSPELFDAARTTLNHRGDVSTGWSMGWKVNFWARLLDGNHAFKLIQDQLSLVDSSSENGGTYANFFDAHPPFQIDGNFGCTAGIAEMLLQSHDGTIHVLPALPDAWAERGGVKGLRAYGGFEVDFTWTNGHIERLVVRSSLGGNARLRVPNVLVEQGGTPLVEASGDNPNPFFRTPAIKEPLISDSADLNEVALESTYVYDISTEPGQAYLFEAAP